MTTADLQRRLERSLQTTLDVNGSPEYVLTWKRWGMPSGPPICALRGSARRTSANGFTGWPTATVNDSANSLYAYGPRRPDGTRPVFLKLAGAAAPAGNVDNAQTRAIAATLAGWTTPQANEPDSPERPSRKETGRTTEYLGRQVQGCKVLASGTPTTSSTAETAKYGVLNPAFSAWLMGLPSDWLMAAPARTSRVAPSSGASATRSSRKSRRCS
jgi:hypothetical protein